MTGGRIRKRSRSVVDVTSVSDGYDSLSERQQRRVRSNIRTGDAVRREAAAAGVTVVFTQVSMQLSDGSTVLQEQGEDTNNRYNTTSMFRSRSHALGDCNERALRTVAACGAR